MPLLINLVPCFPSLTKIAHAITRAHWSGPRFFGLIRKPASNGQLCSDTATMDRPAFQRLLSDVTETPEKPPSSYISRTRVHPSRFWLATKASQASRWASRELKSCSSPSSLLLRV